MTVPAKRRQNLRIDQLLCLGTAHDRHEQIVHHCRQRYCVRVKLPSFRRGLGAARAVMHLAFEGGKTVGQLATDPSHAQNTDAPPRGLARQRRTTRRPGTASYIGNPALHLAQQTQPHGDGQIGHIVVQNVGRIRHDDPARCGGGQIDSLISHTITRDQFQRRQLVHFGRAERLVAFAGHGADLRACPCGQAV